MIRVAISPLSVSCKLHLHCEMLYKPIRNEETLDGSSWYR
jgi:hypothetical protein